MNTTASDSKSRLAAVVLAALTVAAFWGTWRNGFIIYDDPDYVTGNPIVQRGITAEGVQWAFTTSQASNWHPATWLSHMLDCQFFGVRPAAHHLVSVFLHALNVALLFLLLRRMTGALWRSALVAVFFAWHPLRVESVAWVAERKDVLSGLFFILTLWAWWRFTVKRGAGRYALALALFALGLMAKPMLVTTPFVLLLLDWWPLNRIPWPGGKGASVPGGQKPAVLPVLAKLVVEKIPFFALAIASSVVTFVVQQGGRSVVTMEHLPLAHRLASAVTGYAAYLGKMIWPANLAVFYPHTGLPPLWGISIALAVIAGGSVLALRTMRTRPYLFTGWCWFLGTLVPVIGVVQVGMQSMADRYTYLPSIGIGVAAAWAAGEIAARGKAWASAVAGAGCAVAAVWFALCLQQVAHWRDDWTLFAHASSVTSRNYVANAVLGTVTAREGRFGEARPFFESALEIRPQYAEGHVAYGNMLLAAQRLDEAAAQFKAALDIIPLDADALSGLGTALVHQDRPQEANTELDRALAVNPGLPSARVNRAMALMRLGRAEESRAEWDAVLRIDPAAANALLALGNSLLVQHKFVGAMQCFRQLLQFQPDSVHALNRLAWLLATHADAQVRDGAEAVRLATRACQLTGNVDPFSLISLATAYAEAGRYEDAVGAAQRAAERAVAGKNAGAAGIAQKLIELFKAGTPYRE